MASYTLQCELKGHEEDVRGLASHDGQIIFTSSRDKTIRVWSATGKTFESVTELVGHTNYVGPLAWVPAGMTSSFPQGALISGSRDTTVIAWDAESAVPLITMKGHGYQVTAVAYASDGTIISASLDKTVKIWKDGKCVRTLEGHAGPVLSLVALSDDEVISGSGDSTIRRWNIRTGACTQTITGHTDTVRGLALLPNIGFVSASHDHTVKVWTGEGQVLAELLGHTAIIYSVAASSEGLVASGAEDNTARVWRASGECLQVLEHPGCVWDVKFLPDGSLVTACADGVARVWTTNPDLVADADTIAGYEAALAARKAAASKEGEGGGGGGALPDGLKVEDAGALLAPGKKDGETKIISEGGGAMAYGWSAARGEWEKIGEVVAGPGEGGAGGGLGGKKMWGGREWDYVFDVDVEDGTPPRKLAGDLHENPYIVADRFLQQEELPAYFKEQIVQFILQNTGQLKATSLPSNMPITGGFCDPFTGGPSTSSDPPPAPRATPIPSTLPTSITGGFVDPFTGSGSTSTAPPTTTPASGSSSRGLKHIPSNQYLLFDKAPPPDPLLRKIREFNAALAASPDGASVSIPPADEAALEALVAHAAARGSGVTPADVALLQRLLRWPAPRLFPVLDLARLAVLDPAAARHLGPSAGDFGMLQAGTLAAAMHAVAAAPGEAAGHQTALRLACNMFKTDAMRAWCRHQRPELLDRFSPCAGSGSKAVRGSLAALLQNLALLLTAGQAGDSEGAMQVLSAVTELLDSAASRDEDPETVHRCLVTVGTLALADAATRSLAAEMGLQDLCSRAAAATGGRATEALEEVLTVLGAK